MVTISGIPRQNNENTSAIALRVANLTGCPLQENDIDISHRTSALENAGIIVKFVTRDKRDAFFKSREQLKVNL